MGRCSCSRACWPEVRPAESMGAISASTNLGMVDLGWIWDGCTGGEMATSALGGGVKLPGSPESRDVADSVGSL
jgi:hypothetical protein